MLINFCDSAFAIGEPPPDKNVRYLKQIKQRNTAELYGADNVCVCLVNKPHNFLQYELIGFRREWEHLKERLRIMRVHCVSGPKNCTSKD